MVKDKDPRDQSASGPAATDAGLASLAADQRIAELEAQLQEANQKALRAGAELENYRKRAQREMAAAMHAQQELMLALTSGRDSATLLKLEADQNKVRDQVLRTIGRMHEELASAVGTEKWQGTSAELEKKYSRYFRPRK